MTTKPALRKRSTIHIGSNLAELLESGQCSGATMTARLETLAGRYATLTNTPPLWPVESWVAAIKAAAKIDLTSPAVSWSLIGMVKHDKLDAKLGYALETIKDSQVVAVIGVAERFLATKQEPTKEAVTAFLTSASIPTTSA